MNKEIIENLLLSELEEVKGGQAYVEIGKDLNINVATLKSFIFQIVEQSSKSITFMGGILVFPEQLLIKKKKKRI